MQPILTIFYIHLQPILLLSATVSEIQDLQLPSAIAVSPTLVSLANVLPSVSLDNFTPRSDLVKTTSDLINTPTFLANAAPIFCLRLYPG